MKNISKILSLTLLISSMPTLIIAGRKSKNSLSHHPKALLSVLQPPITIHEPNYTQDTTKSTNLSESVIFVNNLEKDDEIFSEKINQMLDVQKQLRQLKKQREKIKQEGRTTIENLKEKLAMADQKIESRERNLTAIGEQRKTLVTEISQALLAKDADKKQYLEQQLLSLDTQEEDLKKSLLTLRITKLKIQQKINKVSIKKEYDEITDAPQQIEVTQAVVETKLVVEQLSLSQESNKPTSRSWLSIFTLGLLDYGE